MKHLQRKFRKSALVCAVIYMTILLAVQYVYYDDAQVARKEFVVRKNPENIVQWVSRRQFNKSVQHIENEIGQSDPKEVFREIQFSTKVQQTPGRGIHQQVYEHSSTQTVKQDNLELRHIGFVKVHKAASSTMQNIFFRFGLKRNLTFVLSTYNNYFSKKSNTYFPLAKPLYRDGYDILCNHGIFNHTLYSSLLPNDTVYLAIVRDPLSTFISAVNYYSNEGLNYLKAVPGNKVKTLIHYSNIYDKEFFSYTRNAIARDLGFPTTYSLTEVDDYLNSLEKSLKLVLLVEYFDESLVLMRRYLNWKLEDILYISNNVYGKGYSMSDLKPIDIDQFQIRNKLDYKVYNYFYKRFWNQFSYEGLGIHNEVLHFKGVLRKLVTFCNIYRDENTNNQTELKTIVTGRTRGKGRIKSMASRENLLVYKTLDIFPQNNNNRYYTAPDSTVDDIGLLIIQESKWNEEFSVDFEDCRYMKLKELSFIKVLKHEQGSDMSKIGAHLYQAKGKVSVVGTKKGVYRRKSI